MGGKKGFTLVELSLSVGFIALLSLTITLIINDTVATYRRGLTLNELTTTGMDLVDDMRSALQNSPARAANYECAALYDGTIGVAETNAGRCYADQAENLVFLQYSGMVQTEDNQQADLPLYGVVCTGEYSYIWNSGYFFGQNNGEQIANAGSVRRIVDENAKPAAFKYEHPQMDEKTLDSFRLLKIKDERRGLCKKVIKNGGSDPMHYGTYIKGDNTHYPALTNQYVFDTTYTGDDTTNFFPDGLRDEEVEIVMNDDITNQLALYDFTITPPVTNSSGEAAFYSASFILGTTTGGINVAAKGNFCNTPEDYLEDFDYCAINKFNFAAQATGG